MNVAKLLIWIRDIPARQACRDNGHRLVPSRSRPNTHKCTSCGSYFS